ncbi:xaa-pro dipeptidase [Pyrenophora seminiperda CCB06]|uniref:Xaa-pro dipeptidase n=1 Tax=Pyrenophora seminiperda CCB06 TaxID=1302712 RepID=A0A3M7M252_9PLEO|nr:xaa-pro dipeptidase [Pyrenophora seminiperda CCB06]
MSVITPTASPTGPFNFFGLPRELRDAIYAEVWPTTASLYHDMVESSKLQLDFGISYNVQEGAQKKLHSYPSWARVNRQFLRESMEQFYRNFHVHGQVPGSRVTTSFRFGRVEDAAHEREEAEKELACVLRGKPVLPGYIPEAIYPHKVIEVTKTWPINLSSLKRFEHGLLDKNGKRSLCITFGIAIGYLYSPTIDLSAFEATGFELDELVVEVVFRLKYCTIKNKVFSLVQGEVKRLGSVLVGESDVELILGLVQHWDCWRFEVTKKN